MDLDAIRPEIFNTDQGAQFTASALTPRLEESGVAISMDGRGRALDNVFDVDSERTSTIGNTPRKQPRGRARPSLWGPRATAQ